MPPTMVLITCLLLLPILISANRKFQNGVNQQNIQSILESIDERLRNLEAARNLQYTNNVVGKIDQNHRKLDMLESRIGRFETVVDVHFDKVAENMSNRYFKEDLAKDHVLRKIDATYERMHHRVLHLEMRMEMGEKKIMDKLDLLMTRFDKMEDTVTTRESDIEEEIGEVLIVMEEIKLAQSNVEAANLTNFNISLNSAVTDIRKNSLKLNDKFEAGARKIEEIIHSTFNRSLHKISKDEDLVLDIEEYLNKILSTQDDLLQKSDHIHGTVKNIASVANLTRNEQQNGFRNLVVQVGRLGGKNNILSDSMAENGQLKKLGDKIDDNFKNIMILQNLFLESCHRIQMDETQLESKISEVLEKLIDTFEQKASIEIKDIENLEQILKAHDTNIKRSLYATTHNMGVLLKKGTDGKDDVQRQLIEIENGIVAMNLKFDELKMEGATQIKNVALLEKLEKLEYKLQGIHNKSEGTNSLIARSIQFIENIQADLLKMSTGVASQTETRDKHINDLRQTLTNILTKLSIFEKYTNKTETSDKKALERPNTPTRNDTITFDAPSGVRDPGDNAISDHLESLIEEVFGIPKTRRTNDSAAISFVEVKADCTDLDIDVRNSGNATRNCSGNCVDCKVPVQDEKLEFVDREEEPCTNYGINVRSNAKCNQSQSTQNCTEVEGIKKCNSNSNQLGMDTTNFDVQTGNNSSNDSMDEINFVEQKSIVDEEKIFFNHPNNDVLIDIRNNRANGSEDDLQLVHRNLFNLSDSDLSDPAVASTESVRFNVGEGEVTNKSSEVVWD